MSKQNLINLLENDFKKLTDLIEKIKSDDREFLSKKEITNLKSNQDLIDQMEAYKARSNGEITQINSAIDNCYYAIDAYNSSIDSLNALIITYQGQITDLETQIANDDLIIAYIPPDQQK